LEKRIKNTEVTGIYTDPIATPITAHMNIMTIPIVILFQGYLYVSTRS